MRYLFLLLAALPCSAHAQLVGDTETGLASYYSREYDGAQTAYDLTYNRNELVAAHRSWPVNSTVEVKNLDNGKSVRVRIIDKGPFIRGRVVEVSEKAAGMIGLTGKVTVLVEITLRSIGSRNAAPPVVEARTPAPDPAPAPAPKPASAAPPKADSAPITKAAGDKPIPAPIPAPRPTRESAPATTAPKAAVVIQPAEVVRTPVAGERDKDDGQPLAKTFDPGVYRISLEALPQGDHAVQIASFRDLEGAMSRVAELQARWFRNVLIERVAVTGGSLYKVLLGPFDTEEMAKGYAASLQEKYRIAGFVVRVSGS